MHFSDDYKHTLCGIKLTDENDDEWVDDLTEYVDGGPEDNCEKCYNHACDLYAGRHETEALTDEDWGYEIAREEGMLNGIHSWNDWREDWRDFNG